MTTELCVRGVLVSAGDRRARDPFGPLTFGTGKVVAATSVIVSGNPGVTGGSRTGDEPEQPERVQASGEGTK